MYPAANTTDACWPISRPGHVTLPPPCSQADWPARIKAASAKKPNAALPPTDPSLIAQIKKATFCKVAFVNSSAGWTPARSHQGWIRTCQLYRLFRGCSEVRQSESYEPAFGNHSTSDHLLSIVEDNRSLARKKRFAKRFGRQTALSRRQAATQGNSGFCCNLY